LFAIGAIVLARSELSDPATNDEVDEPPPTPAVHSARRIVGVTFGVLFVAEWGDLSQLLTAGLAARTDAPLSVFLGSAVALVLICGVAALAGRGLLRVLPVHILRRAAGVLFAVLAVITALEAAGLT
jgi:putative Ca2+/H+ antiporter (TMEM165/GDT1 family)